MFEYEETSPAKIDTKFRFLTKSKISNFQKMKNIFRYKQGQHQNQFRQTIELNLDNFNSNEQFLKPWNPGQSVYSNEIEFRLKVEILNFKVNFM